MGVIVEDIRISNEFTALDTDYLLGNIGDKITIETDFRVEEVFTTSDEADEDRIMINVQPFRVNVADTSDVIYCEAGGVFAEYRVGDSLKVFDTISTGSNLIIYEKLSDQAVRVYISVIGDVDFTGSAVDFSFPINSYIFLTTVLTSVNYRWNFIENTGNETYLNIIDDQINQARAGGVDNTDTVTQVNLIFDTPVTNNYGSAYVVGNGATATAQKFTVVHETILTPFFLAGQLFDLKDRIKPDYYNAGNALKFITSIDVGRNDNDPNFIQTVDFAALDGNTGWFDENFNGGTNNYTIDSIVYKQLDTTVINSVELIDAAQTVEITVKNIVDTPFLNNNTEFALNFSVLPTDRTEYQNNEQTVVENFYFDRAFNTVGSAFVAGDNNGTSSQIFTEVSATFVSTSEILITAKIDLESAAITDITSRGIEYFMWVAVQDHLLNTEASDRVALIADIKPFFIDLTDDGMIEQTHNFLRHFESDVTTEGTTTPIARTEDDILAYSQFTIDRTGRTADDITINNVTVDLIAKKSDGSEFNLETYTQSFNGTQVIGDAQFIDNESERVFKMPDADARKTIKFNRRIDLDTADLRYYEIYYPFLFRWEYWTALAGVNGDAFNTAEDNNGQNEQWHRYDTLVDWDIYYRTTVTANKNGTILTYQKDSIIETFTYEEGTDWINEDIEGFNADTLVTTGTLLISPTKIVATKEYSGANVPATTADVEWVMRIEIYEQGGISDIRYLSSVYDWTQYSWFNSVDTSNKLIKTKVGNVFTAEALIDFSALPSDATFKISARIYDEAALAPIPVDAKLTEDGTVKFTEDDEIKILD